MQFSFGLVGLVTERYVGWNKMACAAHSTQPVCMCECVWWDECKCGAKYMCNFRLDSWVCDCDDAEQKQNERHVYV